MFQGLWPLIFWGYSWIDRDVPYGLPILILTHQISSWYNGGFSISCGASCYRSYSTAGSIAVLKRSCVETKNVFPFWRSNTQRSCHKEVTCSMNIPCVWYQLQLWRVILCWLLTAEGSGSSPRWERLTNVYHNYLLKGLNVWYMHCSQKHFSG